MGQKRERKRSRRRSAEPMPTEASLPKLVQPLHRLPVYELVNEETLELVHQTSMRILSEVGIAFYDDELTSPSGCAWNESKRNKWDYYACRCRQPWPRRSQEQKECGEETKSCFL